MDTRKLREELIERLKTADESTLREVQNILRDPEADYKFKNNDVDEMSELLEKLLKQSSDEIAKGNHFTTEEVMAELKEKYPFLKK